MNDVEMFERLFPYHIYSKVNFRVFLYSSYLNLKVTFYSFLQNMFFLLVLLYRLQTVVVRIVELKVFVHFEGRRDPFDIVIGIRRTNLNAIYGNTMSILKGRNRYEISVNEFSTKTRNFDEVVEILFNAPVLAMPFYRYIQGFHSKTSHRK